MSQGGKQPVSLGGTPVRLLELMSSQLKLPSADHEGGSDPAHNQAAFMIGAPPCRAKGLLKMSADKGNLRAWGTHLSDGWYTGQASSSLPAQTMRVAATLHTDKQHSSSGYM